MTNQPQLPDLAIAKHLLANLRRTHLEMEFNIRQKRLMWVRRSLDAYKELPNF